LSIREDKLIGERAVSIAKFWSASDDRVLESALAAVVAVEGDASDW
jgi:hypothetical protein